MGFLKILSDFLDDAKKLGNEVQRQTNKFQQQTNKFQQQRPVQQQPAQQPQPQQQAQAEPEPRNDYEWRNYFRDIIHAEFPQYSVQENVPVTQVVGYANDSFKLYPERPFQAYKAEWGKPYTFILSQNGMMKGIVMLGGSHSHCSKMDYLVARMYAKKASLPYINFYTTMPNERGYVVERIRKFLN